MMNHIDTHNLNIETTGRSQYRLTTSVLVPRPRRDVFAFFSDAENLAVMTPDHFRFQILTERPIEMTIGALIDYKIRVHGIPLRWRTRIVQWQPEERFVDEQLRGPYRRWHHLHLFEDLGDSTLMTDIVDYSVVLGFLMHPLMVRRDLQNVFTWRTNRILEVFKPGADAQPREVVSNLNSGT